MQKEMSGILIGLLIFPLLCITEMSFSQVTSSKNEKKKEKAVKDSIDYRTLGTLLETRKIVFQTEFVQPSTGIKVYNVIRFDSSLFFMRCENPPNTSGRNTGVLDNSTPSINPYSGIFFDGIIKDWELTTIYKNKYYIIKSVALDRNELPWGNITLKVYLNKSASIEIKSRSGNMIYANYTGMIREL